MHYLGIFRDIDAYLDTLTGAQLGGEGRTPMSFLKIENSAQILEKKALIVSFFQLQFPLILH